MAAAVGCCTVVLCSLFGVCFVLHTNTDVFDGFVWATANHDVDDDDGDDDEADFDCDYGARLKRAREREIQLCATLGANKQSSLSGAM